jgi:hypothetical protein
MYLSELRHILKSKELLIGGCPMRMSSSAVKTLSATFFLLLTVPVQLARAEPQSRSVISTHDEKKRQTVEPQSKLVISAYEGKKRQTNQIAVTVVVSGSCAQRGERS